MDKNTLSNYGWIVIAVLVLSVMIALATPFGSFIEQGVRATTEGLFDTSKDAVNTAFEDLGVQMDDQTFEEGYTGVNETPATKLPAKGKTLEEYTWAEVQQIVQAGAATEYGLAVGQTKTVEANGAIHTATIIGLNHDGENTATFLLPEIDRHAYADSKANILWSKSEVRRWLNDEIYNSMRSVNQYIIPVDKKVYNLATSAVDTTTDKLFLLSMVECKAEYKGIGKFMISPSPYSPSKIEYFLPEGTCYEYFTDKQYPVNLINSTALRTGYCSNGMEAIPVYLNQGISPSDTIPGNYPIRPAFVIG